MTAAISGEICTARLLLKHEANGLLCNTTGQTANQIAKQCKNDELANFIERKANQNLSNSGTGEPRTNTGVGVPARPSIFVIHHNL